MHNVNNCSLNLPSRNNLTLIDIDVSVEHKLLIVDMLTLYSDYLVTDMNEHALQQANFLLV